MCQFFRRDLTLFGKICFLMFVATVILLKWPATVKRESSTNAGRLREDCLTEVQFINKLRAKQIERNKERLEKLGFYNLSALSIQEPDHSSNIVFLVLSVRKGVSRRQILRKIFDKDNALAGLTFKKQVLFVFGIDADELTTEDMLALKEEQDQNSDLMIWHIEDTYNTLHFKTLASMGWIGRSVENQQSGSNISLVFKVDDDVIVNHWKLEVYIKESIREPEVNNAHSFHCHQFTKMAPKRSPQSKWYLSQMDWPEKVFSPYCHGPFYAFSPKTAQRIFQSFEETFHENYLAIEDVYITGILADTINATRIDFGSLWYLRPFRQLLVPEEELNKRMIFNMQSVDEKSLLEHWQTLKEHVQNYTKI